MAHARLHAHPLRRVGLPPHPPEQLALLDKTRFIRRLEDDNYVLLIRPRRFGKSCWVSLLENYYDRRWKDDFDEVFGGTEIGRDPIGDRHAYVTLRFDFSVVKDTPETLEREF